MRARAQATRARNVLRFGSRVRARAKYELALIDICILIVALFLVNCRILKLFIAILQILLIICFIYLFLNCLFKTT